MKIGIDASRAFQNHRTGIEEYAYQVISHLKDKLEGHQVVLYIRKTNNLQLITYTNKINGFILPQNWKVKIIKWPRFWTQMGLSLEMLFHPVDVLFVPAHNVPVIHPKKTVVTIHGLEYEKIPEAYSFWERLYMRVSIKLSCRWAKKIIAVSKNTKRDLIELYSVPEEKVTVVYEGTSNNFRFSNSDFRINANNDLKFKIGKPYLLFIGRLEKRKNVEGIIEAFDVLREKYHILHKLVLVGKPGFGYESIKYKVESSEYKAEIIETGFVTEEEKYELFRKADVFLFPSFYEGFGLPILEAQHLGIPVVTSNRASLPEIAGEGAAYCDPSEPMSIALAVQKIISDENYRNAIIEKGHENVQLFSWERCAEEINKLLT